MAITSHVLHPDSLQGEATAKGRKYSAAWLLQSDDAADGAQVCIDYFTRNIAAIGDEYAIENDRDKGVALKSIKPERLGERARKVWIVRATYEPLEGGKKDTQLGEDGKPSDDPLAWYDRVSIREVRVMRAVEQAVYWSGLRDMAAQLRPVGTAGAVCNSAGVPFDPPLERRETQQVVAITKNLATFPQAAADVLRDVVNAQRIFVAKKFARYEAEWRPLTAMVESLTGEFRFERDLAYWEVTLVVALNSRTWREFVLDRGMHAAFAVGFPDPDGPDPATGVPRLLSFTDERLVDGAPPVRRLVDHEGRPLAEPIRLDGNGQPLAAGAPDVYLEYAKLVERHWLELQVLGFFD